MKADISIYQITPEPSGRDFIFRDYNEVIRHTGGTVPANVYQKNYSGQVEFSSLEDIYIMFNAAYPPDYKGRSLSVSDVVEVFMEDRSHFYYCDTFGFKEIQFNKDEIITSEACYE